MPAVSEQQDLMRAQRFGAPISKRAPTEPTNTPRPPKRPRSEREGIIRAPKELEVNLRVKQNYLFCIHMVGLIESLVSEMVRWREAKERM